MAKKHFASGVALCLALVAPLSAETPTSVIIGTPPQPDWSQLDKQQKSILAPLASQWDDMESIRRKKWLGIAERYPNLAPVEQGRIQVRMRDWATLTPEQRARVRNNYKEFNQLSPEQKQAVREKWQAYSKLPITERRFIGNNGKPPKLLNPSPPETSPITQISDTPMPTASSTNNNPPAGKP